MGRDHLLTGVLVLEVGACAGVVVTHDPAVVVVGSALFLWGTVAPDLDSEDSVASSAYAPARQRIVEPGRFVPRARGLTRFLVPGSHTVSAACRVSARWWYRETRGKLDTEGDDPHRRGWHTLWGALILGGLLALLLSGTFAELLATILRDAAAAPESSPRTEAVVAWLDADPSRVEWLGAFLAAPWAGFCGGTAAMAWFGAQRKGPRLLLLWGPAIRWQTWGFLLPFLAVLCVDELGASWPVWVGAVVAGCYIHCTGDRCTVSGLASFLAPLTMREDQRWGERHLTPKWLRFRTGSGGEALFVAGVFILAQLFCWVLLSGRGLMPAGWDAYSVLESATN